MWTVTSAFFIWTFCHWKLFSDFRETLAVSEIDLKERCLHVTIINTCGLWQKTCYINFTLFFPQTYADVPGTSNFRLQYFDETWQEWVEMTPTFKIRTSKLQLRIELEEGKKRSELHTMLLLLFSKKFGDTQNIFFLRSLIASYLQQLCSTAFQELLNLLSSSILEAPQSPKINIPKSETIPKGALSPNWLLELEFLTTF